MKQISSFLAKIQPVKSHAPFVYSNPLPTDFPCGSVGKESACNVGDLGSIPGLEDPLDKGKATYTSVLA